MCAGLVILFINGFIIYYILLKSFAQGLTWQYKFMMACVIQAVVEILFNETIQCFIVCCAIPAVVHNEVKNAFEVIRKTAESIKSFTIDENNVSDEGGVEYQFDMSEYLFLSTRIAKCYPHLPESMLVLRFQSVFPGEMHKQWAHSTSISTTGARFLSFSDYSRAQKSDQLLIKISKWFFVAISVTVAMIVTGLQLVGS